MEKIDGLKSFSHNHNFIIGEVLEVDKKRCKVRIKNGIQKTGYLHCLFTGVENLSIKRLPKKGDKVAALTFDPFLQVGIVLGPIMTEESKDTLIAKDEEKDFTFNGESLKSTIKKLILDELNDLKIGVEPYGNVVTTNCICHFTGAPHKVGMQIAKVGGPLIAK